jgi:hypothetical protein
MIDSLRSFFGLQPTANRTVLGSVPNVDLKDVAYIKSSNKRLQALEALCARYKDTPHISKIVAVYEKTKSVHAYLVSKKRLHELKLFHLQHTDHFINTFGLIIEVHQRNAEITRAYEHGEPLSKSFSKSVLEQFRPEKATANGLPLNPPEPGKAPSSQGAFVYTEEAVTEVPRLSVPTVSINTYGKIIYLKEDNADGLVANEISYTSSPAEKEAFLLNVATRLGIRNISYVGNAMVNIPNHNGFNPTALVPIIHWQHAMYALNLHDYRLFPVRMQRKRL